MWLAPGDEAAASLAKEMLERSGGRGRRLGGVVAVPIPVAITVAAVCGVLVVPRNSLLREAAGVPAHTAAGAGASAAAGEALVPGVVVARVLGHNNSSRGLGRARRDAAGRAVVLVERVCVGGRKGGWSPSSPSSPLVPSGADRLSAPGLSATVAVTALPPTVADSVSAWSAAVGLRIGTPRCALLRRWCLLGLLSLIPLYDSLCVCLHARKM